MRPNPVTQNFTDILTAIKTCHTMNLDTPTLILLYSGIDIAGWLVTENPKAAVSKRFTSWVRRYMLPADGLDCTALELYAARCGLVHSSSPFSDLSMGGRVRLLYYAWNEDKADDMNAVLRILGQTDRVAVQGEMLIAAFARALERFMEDVQADPKLGARVAQRAGAVFTQVSPEVASVFREWRKQNPQA